MYRQMNLLGAESGRSMPGSLLESMSRSSSRPAMGATIIERDVRDIAQIDHVRQMPRLLRVLAHHSSQLVNYSSLGGPLGMNHVTTQKYADIFEKLFLVRTLEPWYTTELKRLVKTPKLHFLDSGLLAAMRNLSPARLTYSV